MPDEPGTSTSELQRLLDPRSRRGFLRLAAYSGAALMLPVALDACGGDNATGLDRNGGADHDPDGSTSVRLDFSTDIGVLNYAYALEQLEAAFYIMAVDAAAGDYGMGEMDLLMAIRDHEIVHRDFLKAALGDAAIPALTVDFSAVNFESRESVLQTARVFEDLGVAAYNGAAKYLDRADYLMVAGKIVSVEARHAAAIRDVLQPRSRYFAGDDVINEMGLDRAFEPPAVLAAADPFIVNHITVTGL